jgi:hypothetical protein
MAKTERQKLVKKLDDIFSKFIRSRDKYTCLVCGKQGTGAEIHCGHLFSRVSFSTRWTELNCFAQCKSCNFRAEYDNEPMKRAWIAKHGQEKFDVLYMKYNSVFKIGNAELVVLINYYKQRLKENEA